MSTSQTAEPPSDRQIDRINELTRTGRTNWFALLAYQAFAFITILGVEDADFFIDSRQTQLPLIGVEIPTFSFFVFAPALGAALYVYLHLHIRKLIDALTEVAPPQSGKPLEDRLSPWLLTDTILHYRAAQAGSGLIQPRRMDWLVRYTTVLLIWIAGPFVQGAAWWRIVPANEEWPTVWLGLLFGLTCYVGLESWLRLRRQLGFSGPWIARLTLTRPKSAVLGAGIVILSWLATEGGTYRYTIHVVQHFRPGSFENIERVLTQRQMRQLDLEDKSTWPDDLVTSGFIPTHLDRAYLNRWQGHNALLNFGPQKLGRIFPQADLSEVRISVLPPGSAETLIARHRYREEYCTRLGIPQPACGRAPSSQISVPSYQEVERAKFCAANGTSDSCVADFARVDAEFVSEWTVVRTQFLKSIAKPDLRYRDFRVAALGGVELAGVDLRGSYLSGADLFGAQMEGANLFGAWLNDAILFRASLERANLVNAHLEGAILSESRLEGADFRGAEMEAANFIDAQMEGVKLSAAQMEAANFSSADMDRADFSGARMNEANLFDTKMVNADLSGATLQGALLWGAQMQGGDLSDARATGASLAWSYLGGANLRRAQLDGADLTGASAKSVLLDGASIDGALLHFTVLAGAVGLEQHQLNEAIGNPETVLPTALPPLRVASCWDTEPGTLRETLKMRNVFSLRDLTLEEARAQWICSEDNRKIWFTGPLP